MSKNVDYNVVEPRISEIVNAILKESSTFSSTKLAAKLGTTRQAVHRHLAKMVRSGVLLAEGRGRATRYRAAQTGFRRRYETESLEEHRVWEDVAQSIPAFATERSRRARDIAVYALTEMVNNAIDHAQAPWVEVTVDHHAGIFAFSVVDEGMGAFETVRRAFDIPDHLAALQQISKGKTSTAPDRHSGEGLFFTSTLVDFFRLEANGLSWTVDNRRNDYAVGGVPDELGTAVRFEIAEDTNRTAREVFEQYTHDFVFDTTRTVVKLFQHGVSFVSRSEAKRLLDGLERFREVIVDFNGVDSVGQGFADEVFRVWARQNPSIHVVPVNMSPSVEFMVKRARAA